MYAKENTSGFYGYDQGTLYPGWGNGGTQTLDTVPDPVTQGSLSDIDTSYVPNQKKQLGMIGLFVGLVVLLFVFGYRG